MWNEKSNTPDSFVNHRAINALKGIILIGILATLVGILNAQFHEQSLTAFLLVVHLVSFLFAFALYRKRLVFLSAIISLVSSSVISIGISIIGNGIHDTAMLFFPAIIIFSCLILKDVPFIIFGFFIFVLFNSSVIIHWNSFFSQIPLHNYSISEIILINFIFIGLGSIGRLLHNGFNNSNEQEKSAVSEKIPAATISSRKTIAIVEDNEDIIFLLSDEFNKHGYKIVSFGSANELQTWIEANGTNIDLLITDFYLKVSDGRMVIEYIQRTIPRIPIILISGYPLDALGLSIDFYKDIVFLQKPFTARDILEKVELMFER